MAFRDFWRGDRQDEQHARHPLDPLSRESWRNEAEARYGAPAHGDSNWRDSHRNDEQRYPNQRWQNSYSGPSYGGTGYGGTGYGGTGGGRVETRGAANEGANLWRDEYGGPSNPFYGERPLANAGNAYDSDYFAGNGIPANRNRAELNEYDSQDPMYGRRAPEGEPAAWPANQFRTDPSPQGPHRGLGPRGYQRSDERIQDDVCQCLTDDHHIDATHVDVSVKDREVVLTGTVPSRAQKRHAEDLIERLPGVRDVINNLRVAVSDTPTNPAQPTSFNQTPRTSPRR